MALRVAAPGKGSASIVFLHGLGDTGSGCRFLADECHQRKNLQHLNFIFPNAPLRDYPAFGGAAPGWFQLAAIGRPMEENVKDLEGLTETLQTIKSLVQQEIDRGISPDRILVGGFSQGAASTQAFAATYGENRLAGFVSLAGFLPLRNELEARKSDTNSTQPLFVGHGTADTIVPYKESEIAIKALEERFKFTNIQFHPYIGLTHSVNKEELDDVMKFIEAAVPNKA